MSKRVDELVEDVCGMGDHPLAPYLRRWCYQSRQFLAFAEAHATKIRKKARLATTDDELADLLAELAVAALLGRDRRYSVLYEPQLSSGSRAPDFQVIHPNGSSFHVEVTRLRLPESGEEAASAAPRLARALADKVGQFPTGAPNVLVVIVPPGGNDEPLVPAALRVLEASQALPEETRRAFQRNRQRVSAVALCSSSDDWAEPSVRLWQNPGARHQLRPETARYLAQK